MIGRLPAAAAALAVAVAGCGGAATNQSAAPANAVNESAAVDPAGGVADPEAWVRGGYGSGSASASADVPGSRNPAFTPRLRALFVDDENYAGGEVGRLDFNFYTGAQDDDIKSVKVTSRDTDGAARKVVTAEFVNIGKPVKVLFYFEQAGGAWYLDDVASPGYGGADGTPPWTLSLVLKYG